MPSQDTLRNASHHVYRYPQVPLEVDRYPVAPEGLQLEQVHVYVRHGERTPVGVRMNGPPAHIPEFWNMCKTARRFIAAVPTSLSPTESDLDDILQHRTLVERPDGTVTSGECLLGELTDLGRQSTFNYGDSLRRLYVKKLGFLPDELQSKDTVYFRSTNMPRTMESLQQIVHGLYPSGKCHAAAVPPLLVRNGKGENLIGNTYSCKRLEILQVGFARAAADAYNKTLERLDSKVSKYIDGNPIRIDGKPRASGVMDTIRASVAHGIKVPPEFEDKSIIDVIERAVVSEWFAGKWLYYSFYCALTGSLITYPSLLDKTEDVRRLGMGRLLGDMVQKMQHKVEDSQDPLKILVHSTHDTAIAAMCSTFDVYDEKWPAFTASITFELFQKPISSRTESSNKPTQSILSRLGGKPSAEHYVRMRYQNRNMALPICSEDGKHLEGHPEFCTLAAFRERVNDLVPTTGVRSARLLGENRKLLS
ncbi:phosphoglycerate mutase-like protein [Cyathus striatus]|nr:phosphoglycerate mutase-like protein [Cyathus striatus]